MQISHKVTSKPPCYRCQDREPGCHGRCEKYTKWKADYLAFKEEVYNAKKDPAKTLIIDNQTKRHEKWRKLNDSL